MQYLTQYPTSGL